MSGLVRAAGEAGAATAMVIVVEDAQWLDHSTVGAFREGVDLADLALDLLEEHELPDCRSLEVRAPDLRSVMTARPSSRTATWPATSIGPG